MNDETGIQNLPPLVLAPIVDPPVVLPVSPPEAKPALKAETPTPPERAIRENALVTIIGWTARFVVGVFMICTIFPLSFITAIAAFGWLQRRMQAIALRGWWRESPRRLEGTFQAFCDSLGSDAPVERPRWFWRERIVQHLNRPRRAGAIARFFDSYFSLLTLPVHSLWLNFKIGSAGLFTTYLLTGWGCGIMLFSWYFGWLNSFHKGYEDAFIGLLLGLFGSFILILALMYVPMAQAHQAAAGEISAFFQFRVITRLILTRFTAYTLLIAGLALTSLLFEIPRVVIAFRDDPPGLNDPDLVTPGQALWMVESYWFFWSIFFLFALLVLRTFSALVYRSALLKAVRNGTIAREQLPTNIALWFEKLEIYPQVQVPQSMIGAALRATVSLKYRAFLCFAVFLILMLFVLRFYLGYFLVFNEYRGILNHPVVQVPCIDWTPWHLVAGRDE